MHTEHDVMIEKTHYFVDKMLASNLQCLCLQVGWFQVIVTSSSHTKLGQHIDLYKYKANPKDNNIMSIYCTLDPDTDLQLP